jgi:hypothetical protein
MPGPLPKYPITLTLEQERHLQQLSSSYTAPFAEVQRARILLLAHQQVAPHLTVVWCACNDNGGPAILLLVRSPT